MLGRRELLKDSAPMSPVSVEVLSMLRTPALASVSTPAPIGGGERTERDAPVAAETLLALLLRPLMLETGSVKGIVPPFRACWLASECERQRAEGGLMASRWRSDGDGSVRQTSKKRKVEVLDSFPTVPI